MDNKVLANRVLIVISLVGFVLAAFGVSLGKFDLTDASAAVFVASFLI